MQELIKKWKTCGPSPWPTTLSMAFCRQSCQLLRFSLLSKSEASKKVPPKLDMVSPPETPECVRSGGGSNPHHFLIARISSVFGIGIWKKVRGKRRRKYQVMYAGTKEWPEEIIWRIMPCRHISFLVGHLAKSLFLPLPSKKKYFTRVFQILLHKIRP